MPTYEYRCTSCKHDFEKFQRMSDEPVAECPECGASAERRLSGGAGLVFKGSGFYITDYRSDSYKQAQKSDRPESSKAEKSPKGEGGKSGGGEAAKPSGGKSESKPKSD